MDGSFACPECGSTVEVSGLAPGRQVRCGFCDRLLEVPFLPRVDARWRRRRFARPKWLIGAWAALALVALAIVVVGGIKFVSGQYHSAQRRSIDQFLESSRVHENEGRLGQALIDLDTGLEIARKAGDRYVAPLDAWKKKRSDLAQREVNNLADRLAHAKPTRFPLGDWLNLIARASRDPDLSALAVPIETRFQQSLLATVESELASARHAYESEQVVDSFNTCDRIAGLLPHLRPDKRSSYFNDTEKLVTILASTHGVNLDPLNGEFLFEPDSWTSQLTPEIVKALEAKGYLPYRESSPWRKQWTHALYQLSVEISETRQGNYSSSANRKVRIEVRLTLTSPGRPAAIFQTMPTARSRDPLPKLPLYLSNMVAMSGERSDEVERLLYDDARAQIHEKLAYQLNNMPPCPATSAGGDGPR